MIFRFKQFAVSHGAAAMKVGTDGVTLGAWAPCRGKVLDVGCGCGLIGLMAAQRGADGVVLLEIDPAATAEAADNAANSPWADKVSTICTDFLAYAPSGKFDSIISNPPFFANGELAPDLRRAAARHEGTLTPDAFMRHAVEMLSPSGTVSIIIPPDRLDAWTFAAGIAGLHTSAIRPLHTKPAAPPRRVLVCFTAAETSFTKKELVISSSEYQSLVKDFYL